MARSEQVLQLYSFNAKIRLSSVNAEIKTLSLVPTFHHHALDTLKSTRPWAWPSLAFSFMALFLF